jgi:hypothetical protein
MELQSVISSQLMDFWRQYGVMDETAKRFLENSSKWMSSLYDFWHVFRNDDKAGYAVYYSDALDYKIVFDLFVEKDESGVDSAKQTIPFISTPMRAGSEIRIQKGLCITWELLLRQIPEER